MPSLELVNVGGSACAAKGGGDGALNQWPGVGRLFNNPFRSQNDMPFGTACMLCLFNLVFTC